MVMAHVSEAENQVFGKYPMPLRQTWYARKIVKEQIVDVPQLERKVAWKFGSCCLGLETLAGIIEGGLCQKM
jgi:hypothetical protein